jgi:hypothetical protein
MGWFDLLFYYMSLWTTKISILMLYRRILIYDWARVLTNSLLAITAICGVWTFIAVLTACIPLPAFWDLSISGFCHDYRWWLSPTLTHIITDFLIYLLPSPVIWTLRLRLRLKALLYSLFAFGFL